MRVLSILSVVCSAWLLIHFPVSAQQPDPTPAEAPVEENADDADDRGRLKYKTNLTGEYTKSLESQLKATLPLYVNAKERPRSRAALRGRLNDSIEKARQVLQSQGYYAGTVSGRTLPAEAPDGPLRVTLNVNAKQRYSFGPSTVQTTPEVDQDLREQLEAAVAALIRQGAPARADQGIQLAPALTVKLKELGYPFASIKRQRFIVDHATRLVRPRIEIETGPKARISDINVSGLETVDPSYVRLLADIDGAPVYDQREVDAFRDRLTATGLFAGISIRPRLIEPTPSTNMTTSETAPVVLDVELAEANLRQVSAQAGFSTDQGFSVEGSWTHRNFFGRGEMFTVRGRVAQLEQTIETLLTLPNWKRLDQSLNFSLGVGRQDTDAFEGLRAYTSAILERQLSPRWVISGGGRLEAQRIEDDLGRRTFYMGGIPLSARYDGTDDIFDPQDGIRFNIQLTPETGFGDTTLLFLTQDVLLRAYKSVGLAKGTVLAARIRVGSIFGEDTATLPANRRFYAGGGGSIRGYGFQNVGPLDSDGDPFGGRSILEMSGEIRVKVTDTIGVVPFIDVGNVYNSALPKFSGMQYGAGLGLRYHTDFAPVRLDIGTPINPRAGDDPVQVYISIGQSF